MGRKMRVLVCGGRDFDDLPLLGDALERVHAQHVITLLIHGGARRAVGRGARLHPRGAKIHSPRPTR